jgi:hypothetical protein
MIKKILPIIILLLCTSAYAQQGTTSPSFGRDKCIWFEEEDGDPKNIICGKMKLPNNSFTNNMDGSFSFAPSGSGTIDGSGTSTYLAKWQDMDTLTDSIINDDTVNATVEGGLIVTGTGDTQFSTTSGTLVIIDYDADKVGIGDLTPDEALTVVGTTKTTTLIVTGTFIYGSNPFIHVQDQKSSGTDGGTFTSGAWRTRDLNTIVNNDILGASLSSNQITLPSGTYYIEADVPSFAVNENRVRLYNMTDAISTLLSTNSYNDTVGLGHANSTLRGRFTISALKTFEIQHISVATKSTTGFGLSRASFSVIEIYTDVKIWKIAQ